MSRRTILLVCGVLLATGDSAANSAADLSPPARGSIVFFSDRANVPTDQGLTGEIDAVGPRGGVLRRLVGAARFAGGFAWSPNGKQFAFTRQATPFGSDLWLRDAKGHQHLVAKDGKHPSWAPDGKRIAFVHDDAIWTVRPNGRNPRRLTASSDRESDPSWSLDGRRIVFLRVPQKVGPPDSNLMSITPSGSQLRLIAQCVFSRPGWSPHGNRIVFYTCGPGGPSETRRGIYVSEPDGRHRRAVRLGLGGRVAWSPNGVWIAYVDNALRVIHPDGSGLRRLADADFWSKPAWAPDSRRLAIARGQPDVWVIGLDGSEIRVTAGEHYGYVNVDPIWDAQNRPAAGLGGTPVSAALASDTKIDGKVLEATHRIVELKADEDRVAVRYADLPLRCHEVWTPALRSVVRFPNCNNDFVSQLALTGERLTWADFARFLGTNNYNVATATLDRPIRRPVAGVCPPRQDPCVRPPVGDVVGEGSLTVFDSWEGPEPEPFCSRPCPTLKRNGRLFKVVDEAAVQIAASTGELTPLAVDEERILVKQSGILSVLDSDGKALVSFPAPAATGARMQGPDLVVHVGGTLEARDAGSGALLHTWPLPTDATLADLHGGLAIYVTTTAVHVLRLADGRDAAITPPGGGPFQAQIEALGLFYSYVTDDRERPGRVVFVPSGELP